jgi:hypothetical protein
MPQKPIAYDDNTNKGRERSDKQRDQMQASN